MNKEQMVQHLEAIILANKSISKEQKNAIKKAISIISTSSTVEQSIKAIEILLKLIGLGSNFF